MGLPLNSWIRFSSSSFIFWAYTLSARHSFWTVPRLVEGFSELLIFFIWLACKCHMHRNSSITHGGSKQIRPVQPKTSSKIKPNDLHMHRNRSITPATLPICAQCCQIVHFTYSKPSRSHPPPSPAYIVIDLHSSFPQSVKYNY